MAILNVRSMPATSDQNCNSIRLIRMVYEEQTDKYYQSDSRVWENKHTQSRWSFTLTVNYAACCLLLHYKQMSPASIKFSRHILTHACMHVHTRTHTCTQLLQYLSRLGVKILYISRSWGGGVACAGHAPSKGPSSFVLSCKICEM